MALSLNAALVSSLLGWSRPRLLVHIYPDASTTYSFQDGPNSQTDYPDSVLSVSSIKRSIDPLKREIKVGQCIVTMTLDERVNYMLQNEYLFGKNVEVLFGDQQIAEGAFAGFFAGTISEVTPKENGKRLEIKLKDSFNTLSDVQITGYWVNKHPLEIIEDIMDKAGLDSEQYDSDTLDPANNTGLSHLVLSAGLYQWNHGTGIGVGSQPISALGAISKLAEIVDGMMWVDENGAAQFSAFDGAASSAADWTEDDIDEIVQIDTIGTIVNRIGVYSHWDQARGLYNHKFEQNDTDSQTNFGYPGGSSGRVREQAFEVNWLGGSSRLFEAIASDSDPGVGETFTVNGALAHSFAGSRYSTWPTTQPSDAVVSSSRPAYIKIDDEIIECDACTVDEDSTANVRVFDHTVGGYVIVPAPVKLTYQVSERGARGTTAAAHPSDVTGSGAVAWDMTIPIYMADSRLARWSNGAPKVRVTTGLKEYAVQISDLVTLTTSRYKSYGHDGLDNTTKWEVVSKQVDIGDNPKITWELVYASESGAPTPTVAESTFPMIPARAANPIEQAIASGDVGEKHIVSGFTVTQDSGLDGIVSAGVASGLVGRVEFETDTDITFTASKDSYVAVGLTHGEIVVVETSLGAGTPTLAPDQVMVAKVVTDGSGITSITDLRVTEALDGNRVLDSTISFSHLDIAGGVGDGVIRNSNLQKYTRG